MRGELPFRRFTRPSFLGNGLLERARSTSLALLGIVVAMGLGLMAVLANQGWPLLPGSPIPSSPNEQVGAVHNAQIAAQPAKRAGVGAGQRATQQTAGQAGTGRTTTPGGAAAPAPKGSGSPQLVVATSNPTGNGHQTPPGHHAPVPTETQPVSTIPVSTPTSTAPSESAPANPTAVPTTETGNEGNQPEGSKDAGGHGHGHGHGHGQDNGNGNGNGPGNRTGADSQGEGKGNSHGVAGGHGKDSGEGGAASSAHSKSAPPPAASPPIKSKGSVVAVTSQTAQPPTEDLVPVETSTPPAHDQGNGHAYGHEHGRQGD
ncbi:MAG: hypothetical protein WBM00_07635 [Solirubrobacterales bacterium]